MLKQSMFLLFFMLICSSSAIDNNHCSDLLLMPTAFTMEKSSGKISDYELLIFSGTYAVTDRTELGAVVPFPVTPTVLKGLTLYAKQNYLKLNGINSALVGSYIPMLPFVTIGNVITIGNEEYNGNFLISYWKNLSENPGSLLSYNLGIKLNWFIFEYFNYKEFHYSQSFFTGLILFGGRIDYKRVIVDIAGFRPLQSTGEIFILPYLKVSFVF